jgi:hypothetical protein
MPWAASLQEDDAEVLLALAKAVDPLGLAFICLGLLSLSFAEKLAALDSHLASVAVVRIDPAYSVRLVRISGCACSALGVLVVVTGVLGHG